MKQRYRITPQGRGPLSDAEIARHQDARRLVYNYQRAKGLLHRKPLYKDRRAFLALLIIVLLAILLAEVSEKEKKDQEAPPVPEQVSPSGPVSEAPDAGSNRGSTSSRPSSGRAG